MTKVPLAEESLGRVLSAVVQYQAIIIIIVAAKLICALIFSCMKNILSTTYM